MKRHIFTSITLVLMAGTVLADPAEIIKQKALGIRDMNNQRQGITPATPNSGGSSAPAAPAAPTGPSSEQQALIARLERDFITIKPGTVATPELETGLQNDMASLSKGPKPTKPQLTKLATDVSAALAEKTIPPLDMGTLAKNINIVLNCSILKPAQTQTYISAAQAVLRNNGVSDTNVQAVGNDLKTIVNEIQKSKPKLYQ